MSHHQENKNNLEDGTTSALSSNGSAVQLKIGKSTITVGGAYLNSLDGERFDMLDDIADELAGGLPHGEAKNYTPLLGRGERGARRSSAESGKHLQGVRRTAIAFTRSMIGTAILYMPRMFSNGGLLFSSVVLIVACCMSTYNMVLLSRCNDATRAASYGAIAEVAFGRPGKWLVDALLVLNQVGWVPVYFLFVQENVMEAIPGLADKVSRETLIFAQLAMYIPLSWLRQMKHLATTNLIANMCVFIGLTVCLGYTFYKLTRDGPQPVQLVNRHSCYLFLGSVAVAFEGMALVLPIKRSMRKRDRFESMVMIIMAIICCLCWLVGASGYLAYGDPANFITNDLPKHGALGSSVRLFYSFAILCTFPLQLFPSFLVESYLFGPCHLPLGPRKILKNVFRTCLVILTCFIAIYGGKQFDRFVSLIGALGSIPLGLLLPTVLHLCLFWDETTSIRKALHVFLISGGTIACLLAISITIKTWND